MFLQDIARSRMANPVTRSTYAMILAGGRGSRLHTLTDWRAKPAVPFGGKFRIVDFPLSNCVNSGIRRIGIATQYKAQSLIQHIQRGWSFLDGRFGEFINILPAQQRVQDDWYKGTADAVYQNLEFIRESEPDYVLLLAGDHIYKMDYGSMIADHVAKGADMTIACTEVSLDEARGFGVMGVDERDCIIQFQEKPDAPVSLPGKPGRALASMGIYVFNAPFLFELLEADAADPHSSHDFGKDLIPTLINKARVYAHRFEYSCVRTGAGPAFWRDVGTVDSYWDANIELTKVVPDLDLYDQSWPIWTHLEHGPPAKFVFDDHERRGVALQSLVSGGCIISGSHIQRSLLFYNVRVHSYSHVEDSVILPGVEIGRNVRIRRAVIDKRCRIPDGMDIGYNYEEDARRFMVSDNGVILVTPGMLSSQL